VRCLPTASPLPPQNRTSAGPAGSSAVRLHHFSKHAEGGHGRFWHITAPDCLPRRSASLCRRPARATLQAEYEKLHKAVLAFVREDAVCRRLMTVPGVGPVVAVTFKSAVDDPSRITKSKAVGALFGLTPKKYQSGEKDVTGGITRTGDEMARTALYEAANVLLSRITRFSKLKRWAMDVAKRRGSKRAKVVLARKIGIILYRMWIDGTTYRWVEAKPIAAQA